MFQKVARHMAVLCHRVKWRAENSPNGRLLLLHEDMNHSAA
jgi:hypothetical protein